MSTPTLKSIGFKPKTCKIVECDGGWQVHCGDAVLYDFMDGKGLSPDGGTFIHPRGYFGFLLGPRVFSTMEKARQGLDQYERYRATKALQDAKKAEKSKLRKSRAEVYTSGVELDDLGAA
jgi:hypothetical protein